MKCRSCGTEIADKAIICYRCGTATTDPVRRPAGMPPARGPWPPLVVAVVPLLLAIGLLVASVSSAHPRPLELAAAVLALLGIVLISRRFARGR